MTMVWNDRYVTGNAEIDAQHRHMFALVNMILPTTTIEELKPLLMRLYKHTREHFQQEEDLIRSKGYPGLASHIAGHNSLLGRLNAFSVDVGKGVFNKEEVVTLVSEWVMNHIVHDDIQALNYQASPANPALSATN